VEVGGGLSPHPSQLDPLEAQRLDILFDYTNKFQHEKVHNLFVILFTYMFGVIPLVLYLSVSSIKAI
jgi:hypothetical protein